MKVTYRAVALLFILSVPLVFLGCMGLDKSQEEQGAGALPPTGQKSESGSPLLSFDSGKALSGQFTAFYDKKAQVNGDVLAVGWCEGASIAAPDPETQLMYVDVPRLDRECPRRNSGEPYCGTTHVLVKNKNLSDFSLRTDIESNPDENWAILFRSNADGTRGYTFGYDRAYHRWAKWEGGEHFPHGAYTLVSWDGYTPGDNVPKLHFIALKPFASKPTKTTQSIRIVADGPSLSFYEGDKLIFAVEDGTYSTGQIGFHAWMGSCMKVHNLSATSLQSVNDSSGGGPAAP